MTAGRVTGTTLTEIVDVRPIWQCCSDDDEVEAATGPHVRVQEGPR